MEHGEVEVSLTQHHEQLHQHTAGEEAVDVDVPHATAALRAGDVDVEELVLVLGVSARLQRGSTRTATLQRGPFALTTTDENQKTMHAPMATSGASGA